jgi:hypothetical protein
MWDSEGVLGLRVERKEHFLILNELMKDTVLGRV